MHHETIEPRLEQLVVQQEQMAQNIATMQTAAIIALSPMCRIEINPPLRHVARPSLGVSPYPGG